jgi:hypothetical protein
VGVLKLTDAKRTLSTVQGTITAGMIRSLMSIYEEASEYKR